MCNEYLPAKQGNHLLTGSQVSHRLYVNSQCKATLMKNLLSQCYVCNKVSPHNICLILPAFRDRIRSNANEFLFPAGAVLLFYKTNQKSLRNQQDTGHQDKQYEGDDPLICLQFEL